MGLKKFQSPVYFFTWYDTYAHLILPWSGTTIQIASCIQRVENNKASCGHNVYDLCLGFAIYQDHHVWMRVGRLDWRDNMIMNIIGHG